MTDILKTARTRRAIAIRLKHLEAELQTAEVLREDYYRMAEALLDEMDELAETRFRLERELWKLDQALATKAIRETDAQNEAA